MKLIYALLLAVTCYLPLAATAALPDLSPTEKSWLEQHPEIRLGTVPDWAPISMRENGQLSGIAGDYKSLLEQRLGIHFLLAPDAPWREVLAQVREHKLDVVMLLGDTPERDSYLNFTQVLVDIPYVIIAGEHAANVSGVEDLAGKRVAVSQGFVSDEWLSSKFPGLQLVRKPDTHHALEAVAVGEADAYVGDVAAGSFAINKFGLARLKVIGNAAFTNHVRIGIRKDWPELAGILDKSLNTITPEERRGIWNHWVMLKHEGVDKRIVYALVSVLVLLIFIILGINNRKLRKAYGQMEEQVRLRTAELARAGEQVLQEMKRYETLLHTAGDGIHVLDMEGNVVQVNSAFCKMLGYTPEEMQGMNVTQWDAQFSTEELKGRIRELMEGSLTMETLHRCRDGRIINVEINVAGARIGGQYMVYCASRDITQRKRTETALKESEHNLREMFHRHSSIMLLIEPESGHIVDANLAAERFYGYPATQLRDMNIDQINILSPDEVAHERRMALEEKRNYFVFQHRLQNGEIRTVEVHSAPVEGSGKTLLFSVIHDITQRKLVEAALLQSNADLEQFAYSISHDLRAPLRAVFGHLQFLDKALKGKLTEDDQQNLFFALDGAKRMEAMILSLLAYSRVGRKTEKQLMPGKESLEEALAFLEPEIKKTAAQVKVSGAWPQLYVSRDELTRLFQNLVANALHYREEATVPQVEINSSVDGNAWRVSVRDHGIGIDPRQADRLFQFFSRLQSRSRFEGTGMGLALCRKIVEHYQGRIWVESEGEGKGCTFIFELPLDQVKGGAA